MDGTRDLRLLLASRHPLIVARMDDETRFMSFARCAAELCGYPGAQYRAFPLGREVVTDDVLEEIRHTVPLSKTRAEPVVAPGSGLGGARHPRPARAVEPPAAEGRRPGNA